MKTAGEPWSNLAANPHWLLGAAGIGAAGAVGVRSLKNLWDLYKDTSGDAERAVPTQTPNRAKIPVTVTPEEMAELNAGMKVATSLKVAMSPTFLDNILLGGTAVGGAALAWKGMDSIYDNQRLGDEQRRLDLAKKRVQGLLGGTAAPQDAALGGAMKVAEDAIMKRAWDGPLTIAGDVAKGAINSIPSWLPLAFGGGMTLVGASAFNEARKRNKALNNAKAVAEYARTMPTRAPVAELDPVLKTAGTKTEWFKKLQAGMDQHKAKRKALSEKTAFNRALPENTLTDDNFDAQTAVKPATDDNTLTDDNFGATTAGLPKAPTIPQRPETPPANWQPNAMGQDQVVDSSANSAYGRSKPTQGTWNVQQLAPAPGVTMASAAPAPVVPAPAAAPAPVASAPAPVAPKPIAPTYTGSKPLIFPVGKTAALKVVLRAAHARSA